MASLYTSPRRGFLCQFKWGSKRHTIHLGPVPRDTAKSFRAKLEQLIAVTEAGERPTGHLAAWVEKLGPRPLKVLTDSGLIDRQYTLSTAIAEYMASVQHRKDSTNAIAADAAKRLVGFFGSDCPLRKLDQHQIVRWREHLRHDCGLAATTETKLCAAASRFWNYAIHCGGAALKNPFVGQKGFTWIGKVPKQYVSESVIESVMQYADPELRKVLALCRYGGLRFPSEVVSLGWRSIDLERGRMRVYAAKTNTSREIPLFPEMMRHLPLPTLTLWDSVFHGLAKSQRDRFLAAIRSAGLEPWPRLFHSLRASRQTDLSARFPLHVVCAWMGNSPETAARHYLSVTDADYQKALESPC